MFGKSLWDKLPSFMKNHMTVRTTLRGESDDQPGEPWKSHPIETANLITSKAEEYPYGTEYHRPVLDIDFEARLIPSSTPGHYHLYLDKLIPKQTYMNLLTVLKQAGIIQHGFADAAEQRGASSVRLPWIMKDDWAANQSDPELKTREIQREIIKKEEELARLREELDKALPF